MLRKFFMHGISIVIASKNEAHHYSVINLFLKSVSNNDYEILEVGCFASTLWKEQKAKFIPDYNFFVVEILSSKIESQHNRSSSYRTSFCNARHESLFVGSQSFW